MHLSVVDNFKDEAALSKEIMRSILTEDVKIVIVARILEEECKRSAFWFIQQSVPQEHVSWEGAQDLSRHYCILYG